jgi:hypothetical protein
VLAPRVLAIEAKRQSLRRCGKWTERDLETPGAGHHASDRHKARNLLTRLVDLIRQTARTIRSDGQSIASTDLLDWMCERPDNGMHDNRVVEGLWRLEIKRLISPTEMGTKEFVELRVVS